MYIHGNRSKKSNETTTRMGVPAMGVHHLGSVYVEGLFSMIDMVCCFYTLTLYTIGSFFCCHYTVETLICTLYN